MEHSVFDLIQSLALSTPPLIAAEEIRKNGKNDILFH
jgi:hypothetical protein